MLKTISKDWLIVIGFIIAKLALHFLTNTNYELHRDAFLYYSHGEHLDWGYVSVPPIIAVLSKLSVTVFGNTVFALRLFPALIGGASVLLIAKIIKELKGGSWALIISLSAFLLSPAFLRSNTLFQPVSFNQFFWLLSAYLIMKLINTHNARWWIYLFVVFGVAFLTKYSITFFILAFLLATLATKHRVLFRSKYFFIGGFVSLLIISPNLIWQYQHDWPVVNHMNELQKTQLVNVSLVGFMLDQLLMNLPGVIVWLTGLITFLFLKAEKKYRALAFIYLLTVFIIFLLRGKPYYTLGLYPIMLALGGYATEKYYKTSVRYGIMVWIVAISIPMLPYSLPVYTHQKMVEFSKPMAELTNRWEDGSVHELPQDYADMIAWPELGNLVVDTYNTLPKEIQKNCVIYAEQYCTAGSILFYGKNQGLPTPISFSDNFILWAPDSITAKTMIYVNDELGDMEWLFKDCRLAGQINNPYFREDGIQVYVCTNPTNAFYPFYTQKVAEKKSKYKINESH